MHRTITALAVLALGLLAGCSSTPTGSRSVASATAPATTTPAAPTFTAQPTEEATTPPPPDLSGPFTLSPKDVTLSVKVLEKDCFGSAGCNLTVRVDLGELPARVPDDATFEVTYELRGTQDGGTVGTIAVEEGRYDPVEEYVQTVRSSSKVTAVVTAVEVTSS